MKFGGELINTSYSDKIGGSNTSRAKVYGGWIVSTDIYTDAKPETNRNINASMVFIPDPEHKWEVDMD